MKVLHNMKVARNKGIETIINPAPAIPLPMEAYEGLTHLIVNETEASTLSGVENPTSWDEVAAIFVARGVKNIIITLGGEVRRMASCLSMHTNELVSRACTIKRRSDSRNLCPAKPFQQTRSKLSTRQLLAIPLLAHTLWPLLAGRPCLAALNST